VCIPILLSMVIFLILPILFRHRDTIFKVLLIILNLTVSCRFNVYKYSPVNYVSVILMVDLGCRLMCHS